MPVISAVVATLNRTSELDRFLHSVTLQKTDQVEVIIVDQNDGPLLNNIIAKHNVSLSIVHLKMIEANQSRARNYGASVARGSIICFPDDDCWFGDHALKKVLSHFHSNPDTDMLIINWQQNPVKNVQTGIITPKNIYSFKSVGYATYVMFFRAAKLKELGGFIETIGIGKYIGGGEDSELLFRAAYQKFNIRYDASIPVNHNYIPVYNRDLPVIRARQRAMGLMYYEYPVPFPVILKGMISPFIKMVSGAQGISRKKHLQAGIGRIQGFIEGFKNGKKIFGNK